MRSLLGGVVLLCLVAASGCATVANFAFPPAEPHVYGGVEIDCLMLQGAWTWEQQENSPTLANRVGWSLLLTALVAADFPLSFVADTLTLPLARSPDGYVGWLRWRECHSDRVAPTTTETRSTEPTPRTKQLDRGTLEQ
jgi:uncharacterized protein YceK